MSLLIGDVFELRMLTPLRRHFGIGAHQRATDCKYHRPYGSSNRLANQGRSRGKSNT